MAPNRLTSIANPPKAPSPRKKNSLTFTASFAGEHLALLEALKAKWAMGQMDVLRRAVLEAAEREGLRKR